MNELKRIGVLGGGSWATALVKILSDNPVRKQVNWWVRTAEKAAYINEHQHNPDYLSSVEIHPEKVSVSSDLEQVILNSDVLILAVPSAYVHETLNSIPEDLFAEKIILSAVKGLIPETRQILGDYLPDLGFSRSRIAVITGPCHAEEVAMEKLSYLTLASENTEISELACSILKSSYIRTTPSDDIYGTEYSAVLKNVYAIASGICHGIGLGDNFQAVLVSNAIREIKRFIAAVHPIDRDIDDSAYLGDLMVTAYSNFSRNRTFGNMLGKGYSVQSAQLEMNMVAEGYYATNTIHEMNRSLGIFMPILDFVYEVAYENKRARKVLDKLLDALN